MFTFQRVEKSGLLTAHGIDVNRQDKQGKTVLHYAVASQCVDLVKILLTNKASVEIKDNHGVTVEELAKLSANPQLIRYDQDVPNVLV